MGALSNEILRDIKVELKRFNKLAGVPTNLIKSYAFLLGLPFMSHSSFPVFDLLLFPRGVQVGSSSLLP